MKNGILRNIWFLNTGILFLFILIVAKLGYVQIVRGETYRDKAERQYTVPENGLFDRGTIYFTEKTGRTISAATVALDYTLAIDPSLIASSAASGNGEDGATALADKLATLIDPFDRTDFFAKAAQKTSRYKEIKKHLSEQEAEGIKALDEKALILKKDKKRSYPLGRMAAQVVGFIGSNGDTLGGQYGLERYYNETLIRNDTGGSLGFFANLFLNAGEAIISDRAREGDLVTTIEPTVQGMFERTLEEEIFQKYNATQAMGIIMDPETGAIVGMATVPSFDPNSFSKERNQNVFVNPLVEGLYEMGSVVKAFTVAAGLDAHVVTAETTYDDKGFRIFNTKRISNFDGKARGVVPVQEVLNQSLNVGAAFVMERLGKERFRNYFTSFGLGEETGIDLPNEGQGNIENLASMRDIEFATASFGQGISLTPIATIRAFSALGNGGVLPSPHIVERTEYGFGSVRDFVPAGERRVISKETSREISRMLTKAVDTALLDGTLKQEHYSIAAKTGTAQQVVGGKYSETDFLHTFVGYFPSYNPKFIVFLAVKDPQGEQYASHTLAEPFMQIAKFLINYYEISPDR